MNITNPKNILVFQTAFLGDVVLTLPMIQLLKKQYPSASIDVVTTPRAADLLLHHPAIRSIIYYDKRKTQKGISGILSLARKLSGKNYDVAVVPHRSFRSAVVVALSNIPHRITFDSSSAKFLYNHIVPYKNEKHEIERNIALLSPFQISFYKKEFPNLYPSVNDIAAVNKMLFEREILEHHKIIAIAPGSVWNTKRWLLERYAELSAMLAEEGLCVVIIGGKEDSKLGATILEKASHKNIFDVTGKLSLLQSAELINRCKVLVTNDSAPLHLAVAMRTPIVAIFGPTVPAFGFGPYGPNDIVVERNGLPCRPCSIHGSDECPIGTFDCMIEIKTVTVFNAVKKILQPQSVH
ncbi:MAG: lipopolysaccharide heptosyltransferase II [Bacteroidetes bacterium]|nr:lipopolysaccharide heptosyltransferase II [Bacteroidota bacterium]